MALYLVSGGVTAVVRATTVLSDHGTLVFSDDGEVVCMVADGQWKSVRQLSSAPIEDLVELPRYAQARAIVASA